jgi:hypothetical protein
MTTRTVFGIVGTHLKAERLVAELLASGFLAENVSILTPDEARKQTTKLDVDARAIEHAQTETNAPEGAAIGATAGTAFGGSVGLLAGLGALVIPGIGFFLAAGPILATLGGLGVGAAVGGLTGGLVGFGIPDHHARKFEMLVKDGNILVAAHCSSSVEQLRATQVFARADATNIVSSVDNNAPTHASEHLTSSLR